MANRILITGVTGFLGRHLTRALSIASENEVFGVARGEGLLNPPNLPCHWLPGDLTDAVWTRKTVQAVRPTHCYHLAGQSRESASWSQPWRTYEANLHSQLNLLEAMATLAPDCRTLIASSSSVYGFMSGTALRETDPLRPVSPYGVSKASQELMARQYAISHRLPTIVTRNFNIIGPGQSPSFAFSSFACQIARAERGEQPALLETGNLEVSRDFLDVQDWGHGNWLWRKESQDRPTMWAAVRSTSCEPSSVGCWPWRKFPWKSRQRPTAIEPVRPILLPWKQTLINCRLWDHGSPAFSWTRHWRKSSPIGGHIEKGPRTQVPHSINENP